MANGRVLWVDQATKAATLRSVDEVPDLLRDGGGWLWLDVPEPDAATAGLLTEVPSDATVLTLTEDANPKGFQFEETQPEVVVQQLSDPAVDAAVINANFILTAGLDPNEAIESEEVEGNPYANMLVWRTGDDNPGIAKLEELLHSTEVADFITETWPSGDVIPGKA